MKVVLERYHGLGNDYLVFDPNHNELELDQANVKMICDRNEGLGADGVLEGPILKEDGMHVKVWNPDGSESETSGNGVRIFAKYLKDAGYVQKKNFKLYTGNGPVEVTFLNEDGSRLRVSMGKLSFWSDEIPVIGERREVINEDMVFGRTLYPVTCVSIGNLSEDQVFSFIIQNLHLLCTGLFKYPVSKSCKTQYIDIHDTVSRMHTDQILLRLHCKLFRYEHYEILQWVFF